MDQRIFRDPAVLSVPWQDLRQMSGWQILTGLLLTPPWLILALYFAESGWLFAALSTSAILFMCGLRQAHDGFHLTLGLPRLATDTFLFLLSLVMVVPLHAVKYNHLRHHAHPLADDDIEGASARMPALLAILSGPLFTVRQLIHAFRHARRGLRMWLFAESLAVVALIVLAVRLDCFWLRYHVVAMLLGNCLTGFFAVWIVHRDCDPEGVFARSQRGWLINGLTLNLFYHLEHHLFPAVPTCHLPELARRLDAVLPDASELPVIGPSPERS